MYCYPTYFFYRRECVNPRIITASTAAQCKRRAPGNFEKEKKREKARKCENAAKPAQNGAKRRKRGKTRPGSKARTPTVAHFQCTHAHWPTGSSSPTGPHWVSRPRPRVCASGQRDRQTDRHLLNT